MGCACRYVELGAWYMQEQVEMIVVSEMMMRMMRCGEMGMPCETLMVWRREVWLPCVFRPNLA